MTCFVDPKHHELETALKSLNSVWEKNNSYSACGAKNLPEEEVNRVKTKYTEEEWGYRCRHT